MGNPLQAVWDEVSPDPDPVNDLGYKYDPLTVVHVKEDGGKYIFLPKEEDHLFDSEFIIASAESVCPLDEYR